MIVVTGTGRSGTSVLAALYKELGFDPGGRFDDSVSAGLEDPEVVETNLQLVDELGVSVLRRRGGPVVRAASKRLDRHGARLPIGTLQRLNRMVAGFRYRRTTPDLMHWDEVQQAADRHGQRLRDLAAARQVVKDPRFAFTLPCWLAAGAPVDAVVVTLRALDAVVDSRLRANMYGARARTWGMHNACYGLGLAVTAATEHRVPLTVLRFPDFLDDADELHQALPLPAPRSPEEFRRAFDAVHEPTLVHDRR